MNRKIEWPKDSQTDLIGGVKSESRSVAPLASLVWTYHAGKARLYEFGSHETLL